LEGLLAIVGLEVRTEGIRTGTGREGESSRFSGLHAKTAPNDVRTNGAETLHKLLFFTEVELDSLYGFHQFNRY